MTQALDLAAIESAWTAALADANIASDDARLYCLAGLPQGTGRSAVWFEPSSTVYGDAEFPLSGSQLADINAPAQRSKHRVCVFAGIPQAVLAAKLRHELEHARQWDFGGGKGLFEFASLVHELGAVQFGGLPQSGRLYNLVPIEQDANRAAASFARDRFPAATIEAELEGSDAVLFRAPADPDPASVGLRMVVFAAIWKDAFEQLVEARGRDLIRTLRAVLDAGDELWRELSVDRRFVSLRAEVSSVEPTEEALRGLTSGEITERWESLGAKVAVAQPPD